MNRAELIEAIAGKTGLSKKDTDAAIKAFTETVTEAMKKGDKVQLIGFGTFETSNRAARNGKNPLTGKAIKIPACKMPKLKFGKAVKDAING